MKRRRSAESPDPRTLRDGAVEAATTAARYALRHWGRRHEVVGRGAHDVKLRLDLECQALAERLLRRRFPGHAFLGEEGTPLAAAEGMVEWVVDPIDGTVNFSHGLPFWCCSVAARSGDEVLAGAVYAPALDELYTAAVGAPARRNGRALRVSRERSVSRALVMTGLDKSQDPRRPSFETFRRLSAHVQKARVVGCAAVDLCRVAAGEADAYFESGIYVWDIAAAGLMVRQAGGRTEVLEDLGGHRMRYLGSNGALHAALRRLVR
jgi:myo-inositol-1(or 4)-monophosphatase